MLMSENDNRPTLGVEDRKVKFNVRRGLILREVFGLYIPKNVITAFLVMTTWRPSDRR